MKTSTRICLGVLATLAAPCALAAPTMARSGHGTQKAKAAPARIYRKVRGQVRSLSPARGGEWASAKVSHENIPGFMAAMTMDIPLGKASDAKRLKEGDKVQFDFVLRRGTYVMENIKVLPRSSKLKLSDGGRSMHFASAAGVAAQDAR